MPANGGFAVWTGVAIAGAAGALVGDALAGVVLAFSIAATLVGALRPRLLVPLIAASCVVLPPYVGWLLPWGGFVNLQRGVMYGALLGVILWGLRERSEGRWLVPVDSLGQGPTKLAIVLLAGAWVVAPVIAMALGLGNSAKAVNSAVYQALAFWVGLRFAQGRDGRRGLQLTFAFLLLYTVPYWLYELQAGRGVFAWYVPPLPGLLSGQGEILRNGQIRVAATFGQPLAFDQFLLMAVPVAASMVYARLLRILGAAMGVLGVVTLVLTRSRSPWVALIVAAVALIIVQRRKVRVALIVAALVTAVVAIPLARSFRSQVLAHAAKSLVLTRYSRKSETEYSAAARVFLTLGALRVIRRHPLAGYGVNATAVAAQLPTVDDYYLALAVEQGVLLAALLTAALWVGWFGLARSPLRAESLWITFAVGAYLVEWVFVGLHDTSPLLFLMLGHLFGAGGGKSYEGPVAPTQLAERSDTRS